jgi:hypothetical protein
VRAQQAREAWAELERTVLQCDELIGGERLHEGERLAVICAAHEQEWGVRKGRALAQGHELRGVVARDHGHDRGHPCDVCRYLGSVGEVQDRVLAPFDGALERLRYRRVSGDEHYGGGMIHRALHCAQCGPVRARATADLITTSENDG